MVSINTNVNQLSALQLLRANGGQLQDIETRLATGLKVASAKDDGATWGMAVQAKATEGAYQVLDDARDHAMGLLDVTLSATDVVSDLVGKMTALALAATDSSLSDGARAALNTDYQALKRQIDRAVGSASFDGANLLDSNGSNFLDYGPGVFEKNTNTPAVAWGSPPRTGPEPLEGEPLSLHFGFTGLGQEERISGTVAYKLRYIDGGAPVDVDLAAHVIPTAPETFVGPGHAMYDAAETVTMPAVPITATNVEIYAEYTGAYPWPDGDPVADVYEHGAPSGALGASGVPHLLARWNERDWRAAPASASAHALGYGVLTAIDASNPTVAISGGTEPGSVVAGTLRLSNLDRGIDELGASATVEYQVFDLSQQQWVTKASATATPKPFGPATSPLDLSYALTLPDPDPNVDFSQARVIAHLQTRHEGQATTANPTSNAADSQASASGVRITPANRTFMDAVSARGYVAGRYRVDSSVADETFDADTQFVLRWNDGSTWQELALGHQSQRDTQAGDSASAAFSLRLPSLAEPVTQAQIVARTSVIHDPDGAATAETHEIKLVDWDSATPRDYAQSMVLGAFDNLVPAVSKDPRRLEIATKIETLDSISGQSTPIREKDTRTVGLRGLVLEDTAIDSVENAQSALRHVRFAQTRVDAQARYYAERANAFSTSQAMEGKVADQVRIGRGQLVDADLAKEAARLEAAKAKQTLIMQALSIANSFPSMILSLFR